MQTKTIDVLILETLATGRLVTASGLAKLWGEDRARCSGWLEKFRGMGLCTASSMPVAYIGRLGRIADHLAAKKRGEFS